MKKYTFFVLSFWSFLFPLIGLAQGLGKSPYSYFGVGDIQDGSFAANQQMANAGVSYSNGLGVNGLNPALVARNKYTTYEVGAHGMYKKISEGGTYQRDFGASINYLALAFPISKKISTSLQYIPYTIVDYENNDYRFIPNTTTYAHYTYKGTGGLNKVAWSNGIQVGKNLHLGLETSYIFGAIDRESISRLTLNDGQDYEITLLDRTNHGDFRFKLGTAWRQKISTDLFLTIGGTYDMKSQFSATRNRVLTTKVGGQILGLNPADTIAKKIEGNIVVPGGYRLGLTLDMPFKFAITADYGVQQWSKYRNVEGFTGELRDSKVFAIGAEYLPNFNALKGFLKITTYRIGFNQTQTQYIVNGLGINDRSFSAGVGFPLGSNRVSMANLGVAVGTRGVNGPIKEDYVKFTLGFSLLDNWFQKYKLD